MPKKPKPKNKRPSKVWEKYKIEGGRLKRDKTCPKCVTSFLANHQDRYVCGKCGYVEIKK